MLGFATGLLASESCSSLDVAANGEGLAMRERLKYPLAETRRTGVRYFKLLAAAIVAATTVTVRSTPPPAASLLPRAAGGQRATKSSCLSSRVPVPGVRKKAAGRASNLLVKSSRRRATRKNHNDSLQIEPRQSGSFGRCIRAPASGPILNLSARMGLEVRALGDNEPP
jgi:hypothetical protein